MINYFIDISISKIRQPLAHAPSSRARPPAWISASLLEDPQQPSLEGGVNCSNRAFVGYLSTLVVGIERPQAVHTYKRDFDLSGTNL